MHEEQLDVAGVVDNEGLVARGHHVPSLLVAAIADLNSSACVVPLPRSSGRAYVGHGNHALEAPAHGIVNSLGLAPVRRDALKAVGLVAPEALGACNRQMLAVGVQRSQGETYASSRWGRASLRGPSGLNVRERERG